jgi:two-component system, NtrC family, nitrogen regulation sensor histidine kinase NtrY
MASSSWAGSRFALGVTARAAAISALAFAAFELIVRGGLYATGAVAAGAAALLALDLARTAMAADRLFADFIEALAAGAADAPTRAAARFPAMAASLARAAARLDRDRIARERRIQELESLLDTVTAALLIVQDDGRVILANRAARVQCGPGGTRLGDMPVLGVAAEALQALAPGARAIVRLADERRMLASATGFRAPDGGQRRLISLQSLSGELSAVELKAWQDLVRVLAHEMMNSLTPIVSLAESLQTLVEPSTGADAQITDAIEVISRRSAGLMSFVGRYRSVAELPEPRPEIIAAGPFAAGLERLMRGVMEEKAVAFRSRVEPEGLVLRADPELLEQAMINLLKNAIEAAAGGQDPRIELSCRAGDGRVVLSVSDNGRGLPETDPEQVFTPFFTTKAGGSGVGLSLARQIAQAHGGALTARRNNPTGATFTLSLPMGV